MKNRRIFKFRKKEYLTKKELIKQNRIVTIFSISVFMVELFLLWIIIFSPNNEASRCMMEKKLGNEAFADGIYFSQRGYYCVFVEGNTMNRISYVDYHEVCHYLVNLDKEHFCYSNSSSNRYVYYTGNWTAIRENLTNLYSIE